MLLEDFGALIGLVLALLGVGLTLITGDAVFDALGTIGIGLLLGVIAIVLIIEMKSLLIGEGARPPVVERDHRRARGRRRAARHPPRTQYLGPEELLVAAKIALDARPAGGGRRAGDRRGGGPRPRGRPAARMIYLEPDLERTVTAVVSSSPGSPVRAFARCGRPRSAPAPGRPSAPSTGA